MMPLVRTKSLRAALRVAFLSSAVLRSAQAFGQLTVDQVPTERTVPLREQVEREIADSRLLLGPFRVTPLVSIDNAGYDGNIFHVPNGEEKTGDWTATFGAGAKAILPMGSKFYLRLLAVPQYVWYDTFTEFNTWAGDFNGSFLALGNRLSFVAAGGFSKGSTILNSETQDNVILTTKSGSGNFELDLTRALSFVAGAEYQEDRYAPGGGTDVINVQKFNHNDLAALAGLRLRLTPSLVISGGVQGTQSEFIQDLQAVARNNQTFAFLGGLRFDRPDFYVNLAGGYRKARPLEGSTFPDYATTVGSYFISWNVAGPLALEGYGHRRPVYSRFELDRFYIETRNGGGIRLRFPPRVTVTGFAQIGTNAYPTGVFQRVDDAWSYGGGASVRLFRSTVLQAIVTQNTLRPADGGPDRTVLRFTTGITFNGEWKDY